MAKLFYKYGAMKSSKSASLLMTAHNYESQGKKVLLYTPSVDNRAGVGVISSRAGMSEEAIPLSPEDDIFSKIYNHTYGSIYNNGWSKTDIYCVLVDESQFLTREQVEGLAKVVDKLDIPVICYGLKNDFQNNLFEGSEALLIHSDKIEEIKTICHKEECSKKAIMNLRLHDNKPVYDGEQVQIGDEEYVPVCRKHYHNY